MATQSKSYKKLVASAASAVATAMLVRTAINDFLPIEVQHYIFSGALGELRRRLSSEQTIVINQIERYAYNHIFENAKAYLSTRINPSSYRINISKLGEDEAMTISLGKGEELIDVYEGVEFKWKLLSREVNAANSRTRELQWFEVSFHKKHKEMALNSYMPFIQAQAKTIKEETRTLKLHMNQTDSWCSINIHHPSTFDTLAMDCELKREVMDDLARFVKRKDYYRRTGKAWKRGYLLYGPPGTGKTSLIAAMANYLKFDIYDLELTEVRRNSTLRRLLIGMSNRSILVVEDVDCSLELKPREEEKDSGKSSVEDKVTLSGLLNFVDGLWSATGEERIIVFTTNYKDRLDPALLRPGRMDMHIHMSYCTPCAFRVLASNYHAIDDHELFPEVEGLIQEVQVTPADVAGELMKSDNAKDALQKLIDFLQEKRKQTTESNGEAETVYNEEREEQEYHELLNPKALSRK